MNVQKPVTNVQILVAYTHNALANAVKMANKHAKPVANVNGILINGTSFYNVKKCC